MTASRVQLQLPIPYRREPRDDERVRRYLERGYRIVEYQRLSDQEVMVILETSVTGPGPAGPPPS